MMMTDIDALLFDMDGTLVDSTGAVEICWSEWANRHGLPVKDVLHFIHGRPARDSIKALAPHADTEAEVNWMLTRELNERHGVVEIPGARNFLLSLAHTPWAIVTSADRRLAEFRLALTGMPRPTVLITVNDVVRGKPDPEGYLAAAHKLGVKPGRCVVIEDAPAGIEAGRRAGMQLLAREAVTGSLGEPCSLQDYLQASYLAAEKELHWK